MTWKCSFAKLQPTQAAHPTTNSIQTNARKNATSFKLALNWPNAFPAERTERKSVILDMIPSFIHANDATRVKGNESIYSQSRTISITTDTLELAVSLLMLNNTPNRPDCEGMLGSARTRDEPSMPKSCECHSPTTSREHVHDSGTASPSVRKVTSAGALPPSRGVVLTAINNLYARDLSGCCIQNRITCIFAST